MNAQPEAVLTASIAPTACGLQRSKGDLSSCWNRRRLRLLTPNCGTRTPAIRAPGGWPPSHSTRSSSGAAGGEHGVQHFPPAQPGNPRRLDQVAGHDVAQARRPLQEPHGEPCSRQQHGGRGARASAVGHRPPRRRWSWRPCLELCRPGGGRRPGVQVFRGPARRADGSWTELPINGPFGGWRTQARTWVPSRWRAAPRPLGRPGRGP